MTIEWNKVTWYSKLIAVILFVLVFYVGFKLGEQKSEVVKNIKNVPEMETHKYSGVGFTISYPSGYTPDASYVYQTADTGEDIKGVKFTIPASLAKGTNLGADSYLSVESLPGAINSCSAEIFLSSPKSDGFADVNGHRYSIASSVGAAAGNRYEETVYATPARGGCLAVRYYIHYSVFENYPPGAVKQFDKQSLLNQFNKIRNTLIVNQ